MITRDRVIAIATATLVASVLLGLWLMREPQAPEPPAITHTADSLEATKPAFDSAMIASAAARQASARAQRRLAAREAELQAAADVERRRADSLGLAGAWELAYQARTREADSLRIELDTAHVRIEMLVADTTRLHQDWIRSEGRRLAVEKFAADLRGELAKARRRRLLDRLSGCAGYGLGVDADRRVAQTMFAGVCVRLLP